MDETEDKEKSFKVEDRRRFSSEGELKPEHRRAEEKPAPEPAEQSKATTTSAAGAHHDVGRADSALAEINFSTFVVGLSTQALLHLGEIPDPATGQHCRDLTGAQQLIDILGMLQEKTRGNLAAEEQNLLQAILFDLRMKYVEIARPGGPSPAGRAMRTTSKLGVAVLVAALSILATPWHGDAHADQLWTDGPAGQLRKVDTLPDFVDLAAKLSPAVVNISSQNQRESSESEGEGEPFHQFGPPSQHFGERSKSLGSGFIINKDGYILTNDHVVEDATEIVVTTREGHEYKARLIGRDSKTDVALVKVDARRDWPIAPLGNSDQVRVGEWVIAIGNPFGFDHSVTAGIVSAKGRFIPGNYDDFIQTDASINPGNSGGPLIDLRGEVVGVNSAIFTKTGSSMGIGFAIPINLVKDEIDQLKSSGKVVRGWLGILVQKVTPDIADAMGLGEPRGALVADVLKDGPGKLRGIAARRRYRRLQQSAGRRLAGAADPGRAHAGRKCRDRPDHPQQDAERSHRNDYGLS